MPLHQYLYSHQCCKDVVVSDMQRGNNPRQQASHRNTIVLPDKIEGHAPPLRCPHSLSVYPFFFHEKDNWQEVTLYIRLDYNTCH